MTKEQPQPLSHQTTSSRSIFHPYLRAEIRDATPTVMEEIMREELSHFLGAAWGESTAQRKGYRHGFYTRDLMTTTGPIEELAVPRDRAGEFHTQAFEQYSRDVPQVAEGLTQMFVAGSSTHQVGEVAQRLLGVTPSASTVSRLNQTLTQQFEAWRERARPRALARGISRWHPFQDPPWA